MSRSHHLAVLIAALLASAFGVARPAMAQVPTAAAEPGDAARDDMWRQAIERQRAGRPGEAAALLRDLLALERRDHPLTPGTFRIQARLISILINLGAWAEALPLAQEGYTSARAALGPDDAATGDLRLALSRLLAMTGAYDQAEPLLSQDLDAELAAGRLEDARSTGYILARVYDGMNRTADADAVRLRIAGGDLGDPDELKRRIDLLIASDDKTTAEPLARRLVALRQAGGGRPLDLRMARVRLARTLFHSTDDVAGDPRIVEAEAIYRSLYAEERVAGATITPVVTAQLGELLIKTAEADTPRQDEGLRINEEALDLMSATLGPDHPETLAWLSQVAVYQFGMMQFDRAETSLARFQHARDDGVAVSFTSAANALTVSAGLALQGDDLMTAHRILSRESRRIHDDLISASRRDSARALQAQTAYIDRLSVAVAWRAAEQTPP